MDATADVWADTEKTSDVTTRIAIHGAEDADRVLTLRFDRFVYEVLATPEPRDLDELERLGAGADLLLDLTGGGMDLGEVAPGMPGDFASTVLALTDNALDQAHRILAHEAYEPPDYYHPDPQGRRLGSLLRLTDHLRDEHTFAGIRDELLAAEPAEDPSVALSGELP